MKRCLLALVALTALCIAGLALLTNLFHWSHGVLVLPSLSRALAGVGLLGVGIGGGALLLLALDHVVRLLGRYARLHYTLLNKADLAT